MLFQRGNAIEKLAAEHARFQALWEDLEDKRKRVYATVLELEDGGGGHKLVAAKKELAEIQNQLEIFKGKQASILEKLEHENFEEIQKARGRLPEVFKAHEEERMAALEQGMELLARGFFLLDSHFKADELPCEIRFKKSLDMGGGSVATADPLVDRAQATFKRLLQNLPTTELQAAGFESRHQEARRLASRGPENDMGEAKIMAQRQIRAARGEAV